MSSPLSLDILKKGLKQLESQHKERREQLLAKLKAKRTISESNQDWLDGAANLADKERLVEAMENAIDYDGAVAALNPREQAIVAELMKHGGGKCDEHRKKQKCECHDGDQKWGAH
jgi:ribosome assembly protein YihI (activator of Der GTPase)